MWWEDKLVRTFRCRLLQKPGVLGGLLSTIGAEKAYIGEIKIIHMGSNYMDRDITIFVDDYPSRDGTCVRDYIHVIDLAQAHILALRALDRGSCVYNLGNGRGFTVLEVIETARRVTGHPIPAVPGPRRPGDPSELVASSEKIARELGWKPRYPDLETIIRTAWEWHRRHPDGYRD